MHVYFVSGTMPGTSHMFLLILAIALSSFYLSEFQLLYLYIEIKIFIPQGYPENQSWDSNPGPSSSEVL